MAILKDTLIQGACRVIGDAYMSQVTASGFKKDGSSDSYVLLGGGGHKALSDFKTSWPTWSQVSSKPSAAGDATTPVYWTGSGFTACTAYSSASVNYASSAGVLNVQSPYIASESDISSSAGARLYYGDGSNWTGSIASMAYSAILSTGPSGRGWQLWAKRNDPAGLYWRGGNNDGSAWTTQRLLLDNVNYKATYITNSSTSWIKIKINSTKSWMLSFVVRVYEGYEHYDIVFSGYNYGSNYWYQPKAVLQSSTSSYIDVFFGYESANNLFVTFGGGSYTGVEIIECVNGHVDHEVKSISELFTITNESSKPTTIQKTDLSGTLQAKCNASTGAIRIYRPWYKDETLDYAVNSLHCGDASELTLKALTTGSTLNSTSGTFAFTATGIINSGNDNVGLQVGCSNDKFQITADSHHLYFRQNDTGGTNSTDWDPWRPLALPGDQSVVRYDNSFGGTTRNRLDTNNSASIESGFNSYIAGYWLGDPFYSDEYIYNSAGGGGGTNKFKFNYTGQVSLVILDYETSVNTQIIIPTGKPVGTVIDIFSCQTREMDFVIIKRAAHNDSKTVTVRIVDGDTSSTYTMPHNDHSGQQLSIGSSDLYWSQPVSSLNGRRVYGIYCYNAANTLGITRIIYAPNDYIYIVKMTAFPT